MRPEEPAGGISKPTSAPVQEAATAAWPMCSRRKPGTRSSTPSGDEVEDGVSCHRAKFALVGYRLTVLGPTPLSAGQGDQAGRLGGARPGCGVERQAEKLSQGESEVRQLVPGQQVAVVGGYGPGGIGDEGLEAGGVAQPASWSRAAATFPLPTSSASTG